MSDTTITPEERAELRRILSNGTSSVDGCGLFYRVTPRLLDALEQSESNVARLTKMVDWLANNLIDCPRFTNCAVDCAECRIDAARRAVAESEVKG